LPNEVFAPLLDHGCELEQTWLVIVHEEEEDEEEEEEDEEDEEEEKKKKKKKTECTGSKSKRRWSASKGTLKV